ncbi:hypothetical protein GCM10009119_01020 [Algoriphagus jejuensis]|uniref:DKNYY family protein n=1 Tax=Algoriphagus jejuensis TaxID=419934 RepID=A0ABP3YAC8_9BACT
MHLRFPAVIFIIVLLLSSCSEKIESPNLDLEHDYQPLVIGNFWIYQVDETIHYGENDSETSRYYFMDRIRGTYVNAENEITFIVARSKSPDKVAWTPELEYTMIYRDKILLRTIYNMPIAALVFPPEAGRIWNGKSYQAEGDDDFEIDLSGADSIPGFEGISAVRVIQEDLDDRVTVRDIRYEVFGKGVGLLESHSEVLTYCSRNDCLGDQLISSGSETNLKLVEYGKD